MTRSQTASPNSVCVHAGAARGPDWCPEVFLRSRLGTLGAMVLALAFTASSAVAQGRSSNVEGARDGEELKGDARVAEIREVERGFYFSVDAGANYYAFLQTPGFVKLNEGWIRPGTRFGLRVGYDILNNINLEVFAMANFNKNALDATQLSQGKSSGDIAHFAPGIAGRFAFFTTDRLFAFARLGVGYAFWFPSNLAQDSLGSIHTDASVGIEYYTKLRHLSVGVEVAVQGLLLPFAFGVHVYPTVKYTF